MECNARIFFFKRTQKQLIHIGPTNLGYYRNTVSFAYITFYYAILGSRNSKIHIVACVFEDEYKTCEKYIK